MGRPERRPMLNGPLGRSLAHEAASNRCEIGSNGAQVSALGVRMVSFRRFGALGIFVVVGLIAAAVLIVGQSKVPKDAIASSVSRMPQLRERAWQLPAASTFQ